MSHKKERRTQRNLTLEGHLSCSDQSDVSSAIALRDYFTCLETIIYLSLGIAQLLTTIRLDTSRSTKTNNGDCLFSRSPASNAVNYSPNVLFVGRTLFASFVSSNLNTCIIFSIFFLVSSLLFFYDDVSVQTLNKENTGLFSPSGDYE